MSVTSPLDIFKVLPKTNCGECGQATCLAFASAVVKKNAQLGLCPHLDKDVVEELEGQVTSQMTAEESQQERLDDLKAQLRDIDLGSRAELLGARMEGGELTIRCLGRDFSVDSEGRISSQCHTHAWFSIPFLSYVLFGKGKEVTGKWITFRNLKDGINWDKFFSRQCPLKLKELADSNDELFGNLISMFSATSVRSYLDSDISVVLHPFPKVPMMVCYWKPDGDLDSDLRVFFDETADQNLNTEAIFGLGTAIVRMLEKLTERHA